MASNALANNKEGNIPALGDAQTRILLDALQKDTLNRADCWPSIATPEQMADRLGVSREQLDVWRTILREQGSSGPAKRSSPRKAYRPKSAVGKLGRSTLHVDGRGTGPYR
jgi:hypothetical protein